MKEILLLNKRQEREEHYIRVRVTFSFLFIDFHFSHVLGTIKLPFLFGTFEKVHAKGGRGTTMCATMVVAMQNGTNINNGVVTLPLSISSPRLQDYILELLSFNLDELQHIFIIINLVCKC